MLANLIFNLGEPDMRSRMRVRRGRLVDASGKPNVVWSGQEYPFGSGRLVVTNDPGMLRS
jgi:hypothetical protein